MMVVVLLADQLSKYWILHGLDLPRKISVAILPWLNFTWVENRGVTFGMFGGRAPLLFMVVSLLACLVLLGVMVRSRSRVVSLCCGAIIGGALGNVLDRSRFGWVEDFIHCHVTIGGRTWSWYVFNVADAAIVCGVFIWMAYSFYSDWKMRRRTVG
ncbi:signal peptidase II [Oecophyllibacter saccharovorans]|uniref:Lipoprotein signal peptidase n=1 Tax=Oecophyllibacter saccharovorans TaxID=2558360 RepID=A0A506UMH7_9PROT|nr:signal peptidase II [Oecophyllibacter saccharovorans]TPW34547.1 signal peptidase II [Oecophyllibacter saccharovorans]